MSAQTRSGFRRAPAKLNLTLEIVGRRPDGYHLLDSLVAFTEYGDEITVAPANSLVVDHAGPFSDRLDGPVEANLVHRAAVRLAEWAGIGPRARITLTKRLPVASGIGGGSSDAAATLLALCALWGLDPSPAELARIGLALGADVPVCLAGRSSRLEGIGETVTPSPPLPPAPVVLVNPLVGLSTPAVFKARTGGFSAGPGRNGALTGSPADARALARALEPHGNDLTRAAIGLLPVIGEMLESLGATRDCLLARMSGSGATCFALYPDEASAAAAAETLRAAQPGWWVMATRLTSP